MLKKFIALYVPGTNGLDGDLSPEAQTKYAQETARRLSLSFGGATASDASGYYVADNGQLVEEKIIIVKAYHDQPAAQAIVTGRKIAQWLKTALSQELVSLETETGLDFI